MTFGKNVMRAMPAGWYVSPLIPGSILVPNNVDPWAFNARLYLGTAEYQEDAKGNKIAVKPSHGRHKRRRS